MEITSKRDNDILTIKIVGRVDTNTAPELETKSMTLITGVSGSGKSTLVSLISRLYDITTGELIVGGHPVNQYDLRTLE